MERPLKQAVRRLPVTQAELEDYMKNNRLKKRAVK